MEINDLDYLTVALPKGKLFSPSAELLAKAGLSAEGLEESSRKLVIVNEQPTHLDRFAALHLESLAEAAAELDTVTP